MRPLLAFSVLLFASSLAPAQDAKPDKYRAMIDNGLAWLAAQQAVDGSWSTNGLNPAANTAYAGMALLADGNTLSEGKYSANVRQALNWYLAVRPRNAKYDGVLADPDHPGSAGRYMMEHGLAMSFLAKLYGEIEDKKDREAVRDRLISAVAFAVKGQSGHGGWFYTSSIEGHNANENVATMLVLQGLFDARNAGIAVPKQSLTRAHAYLGGCTTEKGGIVYSGGMSANGPPAGGERSTITAMALAAYLPMHGQADELTRRWLKFSATSKFLAPADMKRHFDLLPHYYFSKVVLHLNEEQTRALFPDKRIPGHLIWSKYRAAFFDYLQREQGKNGAWGVQGAWSPGPVFNTSLALNILLYEKSVALPLSR